MTAGPRLDPTPSGSTPSIDEPRPGDDSSRGPEGAGPSTWITRVTGVARVALLMAVVVCWAGIVLVGFALAATVAGSTLSPVHAVFQMAMPYVVVGLAVPVLLAALTHRRILLVSSGVLFVVSVVLVMPAAWPGSPPPPSADDLTVFVANVRYNNDEADAKADQVAARGEDVLVVLELTPDFLELLDERGLTTTHPYRNARPLWGAHGAGIFSTKPLTDPRVEPIGGLNAPAATVVTPRGPVRVVAIHTRPPVTIEYLPVWREDLAAIRLFAANLTAPTVLAGDFNAARWHPDYAGIVNLGLRDAHEQLGEGLTFSWPEAGRVGAVVSPFSRLDHALLFDADATAIEDLPAVGSDHTAFSVRVRVR